MLNRFLRGEGPFAGVQQRIGRAFGLALAVVLALHVATLADYAMLIRSGRTAEATVTARTEAPFLGVVRHGLAFEFALPDGTRIRAAADVGRDRYADALPGDRITVTYRPDRPSAARIGHYRFDPPFHEVLLAIALLTLGIVWGKLVHIAAIAGVARPPPSPARRRGRHLRRLGLGLLFLSLLGFAAAERVGRHHDLARNSIEAEAIVTRRWIDRGEGKRKPSYWIAYRIAAPSRPIDGISSVPRQSYRRLHEGAAMPAYYSASDRSRHGLGRPGLSLTPFLVLSLLAVPALAFVLWQMWRLLRLSLHAHGLAPARAGHKVEAERPKRLPMPSAPMQPPRRPVAARAHSGLLARLFS